MFTHTSNKKNNSNFYSAAQRNGKSRRNNNPDSLSSNLNIQTKLTIGLPNDKYEQEADRVADQVMRMPGDVRPGERLPANDTVQRNCLSCMKEESPLQAKSLSTSITPLFQMQPMEEEEEMMQAKPILQRQPIEEEEEVLQPKCLLQRRPTDEEKFQPKIIQKKEESGTAESSSGFESKINQSRGSGRPLPSDTRSFMESCFGTDFASVKVHSDSTSVQMNNKVNSQAFTVGHNIYFGKDKYNPETSLGKHLLAHELTHVIQQQNNANPNRQIQRRAIYIRSLRPSASSTTGHAFVTMENSKKRKKSWGFYADCAAGPLGSRGCSDWELFTMGLNVSMPGNVKRETSASYHDSIRHSLSKKNNRKITSKITSTKAKHTCLLFMVI
jgi:hypothetical protein